jgi:hypothetical protein
MSPSMCELHGSNFGPHIDGSIRKLVADANMMGQRRFGTSYIKMTSGIAADTPIDE